MWFCLPDCSWNQTLSSLCGGFQELPSIRKQERTEIKSHQHRVGGCKNWPTRQKDDRVTESDLSLLDLFRAVRWTARWHWLEKILPRTFQTVVPTTWASQWIKHVCNDFYWMLTGHGARESCSAICGRCSLQVFNNNHWPRGSLERVSNLTN